jgi:hypothetical protein
MAVYSQTQLIKAVASNTAHLGEVEVFERLFRRDVRFRIRVAKYIDNCENGLCKCCFPGRKKTNVLRLRAAEDRILERPYGPREGLRLPPNGDPLLPEDSPPWPIPGHSQLGEVTRLLRCQEGVAIGHPLIRGSRQFRDRPVPDRPEERIPPFMTVPEFETELEPGIAAERLTAGPETGAGVGAGPAAASSAASSTRRSRAPRDRPATSRHAFNVTGSAARPPRAQQPPRPPWIRRGG